MSDLVPGGAVLWTGYSSPITLISTGLNGLASGAISALGPVIHNTTGQTLVDVEFLAGASFSPTGGALWLWLLRSLDDGVSYEDGGPTVQPAKLYDATIAVRAGTSIIPRATATSVPLPPGYFRAVVMNQTGAALPPSNNIIRVVPYGGGVF